jgi:hypothetical protein
MPDLNLLFGSQFIFLPGAATLVSVFVFFRITTFFSPPQIGPPCLPVSACHARWQQLTASMRLRLALLVAVTVAVTVAATAVAVTSAR